MQTQDGFLVQDKEGKTTASYVMDFPKVLLRQIDRTLSSWTDGNEGLLNGVEGFKGVMAPFRDQTYYDDMKELEKQLDDMQNRSKGPDGSLEEGQTMSLVVARAKIEFEINMRLMRRSGHLPQMETTFDESEFV